MALFFRGAGVGTYWHKNDARLAGFSPHRPGMTPSNNFVMQHIARTTTASPYVSLTRSYGVAESYARTGRAVVDASEPAYVYVIELDDPLPQGLVLLDPVYEMVKNNSSPASTLSYHHDGTQDFLIGVLAPDRFGHFLQNAIPQIPTSAGTPRPATLTLQLETIVRALRDAEILAVGTVPASCIKDRVEIR